MNEKKERSQNTKSVESVEKTDRKITKPRKRRRWLTVLLILLVFIFGMITGSALTLVGIVKHVQYAIQHPEIAPQRVAERLQHKLDLTDAQTAKVRDIFSRRLLVLQDIRREFQPRVNNELDIFQKEVSQILTPEQNAEWNAKFNELRKNWIPPLPPPPTEE